MGIVAHLVVHILQGHPALKTVIAGLDDGFLVAGTPAANDDRRNGVALICALGLPLDQVLARLATARERYALPAVAVVDVPPPAGSEPGTLLPFDRLTTPGLARALRLARERADRKGSQDTDSTIGAAVDAALRGLERRLVPLTADVAGLRRQVMGDPRAARHAEALAFGLRAVETTVAAALEDAAGGQPVPVHSLPSLAEPLLKAVLGTGARLECDAAEAPLGLVAADAIELLAHAVCDVRPLLPPGELARPVVRVTVAAGDSATRCRVLVACLPPPDEGATPSHATGIAAGRCGGEATSEDGSLALLLPLVRQTAIVDPQVLVVDDQVEVAAVIADILREDGCSVATVGTAEQALDHLARHPGIRVLVSDVALPGLDGIALATRLRALGCPVRILLITAYAEDRPEAAVRDGLVAGVLPKPFDPAILLEAVRRQLGPG
jgi:CheY-like chemotaxis protein